MLGLSFQSTKSNFFDRDKVKRSADKATRKVLSRFGAFVRQRAKTSIRPKKGTSLPGQPPYSHVGLLRRFIFFAFDPAKRSVVIGPVKTRDDSEAPRLLELGGESMRQEGAKSRRLRHRPRPFMGPAFEQEKQKLPELWRGSVR